MTCPNYDFEQTLFLGCSVKSFRTSLGWNDTASSLTVDLIRDTCPAAAKKVDGSPNPGKAYYSSPGVKQYITGPDPGFEIYGEANNEPPPMGSPCYFRYGDFEFSGIIQNYTKIEPGTDTDQYSVTIIAPTEILSGVQLILGDYAGAVTGFNLFNVYGAAEFLYGRINADLSTPTTYSQYAEDGITFGSAAKGYGGAGANEAGMPWNRIKDPLLALTSSFPIPSDPEILKFSQYGRINFQGSARGGYGLIQYDRINFEAGAYGKYISDYYLDISDVPFSIEDYRVSGPTVDLLSMISQVCQDLAHDFYVELVLVPNGSAPLKIIKFRTVSRAVQPPANIISNFVEYLSNNGEIISSSYGQELRNESTTNVLIGGQKRSLYQIYNGIPFAANDPDANYLTTNFGTNTYVRDTIVPYYGKDYNGNVYVVRDPAPGDDDQTQYIIVNMVGIKQSLNTIGIFLADNLRVSTKLVNAAGGGYSAFLSAVETLRDTDLFKALNLATNLFKGPFRDGVFPQDYETDNQNKEKPPLKSRDMLATLRVNFRNDAVTKDLNALHQFFAEMAQSAVSKVMVRMPYVSAKYDNGRLITSDQPVKGGWTQHADILGIPNPGAIVDWFKNSEDGTINSIAAYPYSGGLDLSRLGDTKYYYTQNESLQGTLYTEVEPEDEVVFLDRNFAKSPRCVVNIPNLYGFSFSTTAKQTQKQIEFDHITRNSGDLNRDQEIELASWNPLNKNIEPSGLAIGFVSNENTYGPWKPNNIIEVGPPGRIQVQKNDELVPWTYGNYTNLNTVAQAYANASVGGMNKGENGSIEVAGYPVISLGSEIGSYNQNIHVAEDRSDSDYNITTPFYSFGAKYWNAGIWTGSSGPNVTAMDISIGIDGVRTSYTFRTFSPRYGILAKSKADKIGNNIKLYNRLESKIRFINATKQLQAANNPAKKFSNKRDRKVQQDNTDNQNKTPDDKQLSESPASLTVGGIHSYRNNSRPDKKGKYKRTIIAAKPISSIVNDTSTEEYDNTSIMSWDGLIRPVSLSGSGGLPRLIIPSFTGAEYAFKTGDSDTNTVITNKYFNFLANPTGYLFSDMSLLHTGNKGRAGHDVESVARKTWAFYSGATGVDGKDSYSINVQTAVVNGEVVPDYADDYRFNVLRGPLWMQGWGYDTTGKPVPNAIDNENACVSGVFSGEGLKNLFLNDWLMKPHTWPVAPLDIRLNRERGVWEAGTGSGPGGTTTEMVMVLDDLPGYVIENMIGTPPTVRAISRYWAGTQLGVNDESEIFEVYVSEPNKITLEDGGCCESDSNDSGNTFGGLYFDMPISNNNVIDTDVSAVIISGGGVDPSSTVSIVVAGVGTINSGPSTFQITSEGNFSLVVNFSNAASNSHVKITGTETKNLVVQDSRSVAVYKKVGYTSFDNLWFTNVPSAPRLGTGQDTGRSASDNWTSINTPVFNYTSLNQGYSTGHGVILYLDGENVYEDYLLSGPVTLGYTINSALGVTIPQGLHRVQWQEKYQDGRESGGDAYGPISNPLWVRIDSNETGTPPEVSFQFSDIKSGRHGYVETIDGKKTLTRIGSCPIALTPLLGDRLDGYITGIGIASANFNFASTSIAISGGTWQIENLTMDPNPSAPTSIDISGVNVFGLAGDQVRARYNGTTWEYRGIKIA